MTASRPTRWLGRSISASCATTTTSRSSTARCLHRGALMAERLRRRREPDLRRPLTGTTASIPASANTTTRRSCPSSPRGSKTARSSSMRTRSAPGKKTTPQALQAGRVSRPLCRHAPRGRGAPRRADPGLCEGRAQQDGAINGVVVAMGRGRVRTCRAGTTFSSSPPSSTACRTSTTSRSPPRWRSGPTLNKPLTLEISAPGPRT